MSKANDTLSQGLSRYCPDIPVEREYRPFKVVYVEEFGHVTGIQDWLKKKNMKNYVLDFAIPCVKMYIEVQGRGFGHRGAGATRDGKKNNQLVKAGWVGLLYPATEVTNGVEFVCEEIEFLWRKLSGIK